MRHLLRAALFLLLIAPALHGQTDVPAEDAALDERRAALLADLRALEADTKELLAPLDAAAARAEIAAAALPLEPEWAAQLLRDALELTFPEKIDRARMRERPIGGALLPPTPEDSARRRVRRRILDVAARDPALSAELAGVTARELGREQEVMQFTGLAIRDAAAGRLEEAAAHIRRAAEAEPTLINVGAAIAEVAARDREAADRLIIAYLERLRAVPAETFAEQRISLMRATLGLKTALVPATFTLFALDRTRAVATPPAGRDAFRAYFAFLLDIYAAMARARPDTRVSGLNGEIAFLWPHLNRHAPDLVGPLQQLAAATERPGAPAQVFPPPDWEEAGRRRYEERLKVARQTKDELDLEVAIGSASGRKEFDEARKLHAFLKEGKLKTQLGELLDEREAIHLTNAGELAAAERLARRLKSPGAIQRVYPPLVRRLVKQKENSAATVLTNEGVARLVEAAESNAPDETYLPSLLAPVAGSIRVFKQSRALAALGELAQAVMPLSEPAALDILDALVRAANKGRITSEHGNPSFDAEVFSELAASDEGRVAGAASRLEDRLQRIAALAAVHRRRAAALAEELKRAPARRPTAN